VATEGLPQGFIFEVAHYGQPPYFAVRRHGQGQASAEVLVVARPRVVLVGVELALKLVAQQMVGGIAELGAPHGQRLAYQGRAAWVDGYQFLWFGVAGAGKDAPAYGSRAGSHFGLARRQPVRSYERIGIGTEDKATGPRGSFEALGGGIHEQTAGLAYVGQFAG
jgi:hypothetical protein